MCSMRAQIYRYWQRNSYSIYISINFVQFFYSQQSYFPGGKIWVKYVTFFVGTTWPTSATNCSDCERITPRYLSSSIFTNFKAPNTRIRQRIPCCRISRTKNSCPSFFFFHISKKKKHFFFHISRTKNCIRRYCTFNLLLFHYYTTIYPGNYRDNSFFDCNVCCIQFVRTTPTFLK